MDASEIAASKSMGGSEGNISQCSVQSSKTRKSAELVIEENGKNNDIHYHISSCSKCNIFYPFLLQNLVRRKETGISFSALVFSSKPYLVYDGSDNKLRFGCQVPEGSSFL